MAVVEIMLQTETIFCYRLCHVRNRRNVILSEGILAMPYEISQN
jgi:hypothetical protein